MTMTARIIEGRTVQRQALERARQAAAQAGVVPHIALIAVSGDDPMVEVNFSLHLRTFDAAGLRVRPVRLPRDTTQAALNRVIEELNADDDVDAIMVLLPLPESLDIRVVLATIAPEKEVEGLHPVHVARLSPLSVASPVRFPVVPLAVVCLLEELDYQPSGHQIVVLTDPELTESNPVAKMIAQIAGSTYIPPDVSSASVQLAHPRAAELCRQADLLIVSLLQPGVVTADWVKPGAVLIDFNAIVTGYTPHRDDPDRLVPKLTGGIDVASAEQVASSIAPVPGGVGPAMLGVLVEQIVAAAVARAATRQSAPAGALR
jgi:methylenetetrahydrofolate dehydrogenase (NADP+) / methenyltetrahydrofolate cyclohydrolase